MILRSTSVVVLGFSRPGILAALGCLHLEVKDFENMKLSARRRRTDRYVRLAFVSFEFRILTWMQNFLSFAVTGAERTVKFEVIDVV